ncbi:MAG: hypothetical protein IIV24_01740 [Alistipes sp.]|nr:hypothetical protein [Alistipes sp.]MBR0338931.1 hypothetical protein [Alistipes sp.]MBR2031597.1 hypothetical protein [Alistipes sp.]
MKIYQQPTLHIVDIAVEWGFGASQGAPSIDVGIGGWVVENEEIEIN